MASSDAAPSLTQLRETLRRIEEGGRVVPRRPLGIAAIDRLLPDGGMPTSGLQEVIEATPGVGLAFATWLLGRLRPARGPVLWCRMTGYGGGAIGDADDLAGWGTDMPYGPGIAASGLPLRRLLLARCRGRQDLLWALEEGLRCPALGGVVGELGPREAGTLDMTSSRRLVLAAETGDVPGVLLRRADMTAALAGFTDTEEAAAAKGEALPPSPATARWRVTGLAGDADTRSWRVELLRARGGRPGFWMMEWDDATGALALAAAAGDGQDLEPAARRLSA